MKRCVTCQELKELDHYNHSARARDGRQARCRQCFQAWYVANRDLHMANVKRRNDQLRAELRMRLVDYLRGHPCVDCGIGDIRVLDFDHKDPSVKCGGVGELLRRTLDWAVVLEEIRKCEVRCANCHRRRTAEQFGWWRAFLKQEE